MDVIKAFARATLAGVVAVSAGIFSVGAADAAHLDFTGYSGNDCTGRNVVSGGDTGFTTGKGLGACQYNGSPVIARLDIIDSNGDEDVDMLDFSIRSFFSGVTKDDFAVTRVEGLQDDAGGSTFGYRFTYSPDAGDPLISAFVAKGSDGFNLYDGYDGQRYFSTATFITPINNGGNRSGLSHITFFDTAAVPVPAAGWMLLGGIGGLSFLRRRRGA